MGPNNAFTCYYIWIVFHSLRYRQHGHNLNNLNMKTTVSNRLTNRQLFELCKKEFTMKQMEENAYKHVFQMFQLKNSFSPDEIYIASDDMDHWAVMYTLNYNAPQS